MEISTGRVFDSPHVTFVETCFPGITVGKGGIEDIVPPFANDYDPDARPAVGRLDAERLLHGARRRVQRDVAEQL